MTSRTNDTGVEWTVTIWHFTVIKLFTISRHNRTIWTRPTFITFSLPSCRMLKETVGLSNQLYLLMSWSEKYWPYDLPARNFILGKVIVHLSKGSHIFLLYLIQLVEEMHKIIYLLCHLGRQEWKMFFIKTFLYKHHIKHRFLVLNFYSQYWKHGGNRVAIYLLLTVPEGERVHLQVWKAKFVQWKMF